MSLTKVSYSMITNAPLNVSDFGAVGDGSIDDTAAIQAALNAGTNVYFGGSSKSYRISDKLTVQSNTTIFGEKPTITQTKNLTQIFDIDTKDNVTVTGIKFVGVGTDFVNNDTNPYATAIYTNSGSSNICITDNEFNNFGYAGIRLKGAVGAQIINNTFDGPGSPTLTPVTSGACYGVLTDTGCEKIVISGNTIKKYAQGLRVEGAKDIAISSNVISNIVGQHGMYIGSQIERVSVTGNVILAVDLIGIKVQAQNGGNPNKDITIVGNAVSSCGGDGISITHGAGSTPQAVKNSNVTISDNSISDITAYGIIVQNGDICTVSGNTINVCGASGIIISATDYLNIANNLILNAQLSGIRDQSPCNYLRVSENILRNVAIAGQAGDKFGIFIQSASVLEISSNVISDSSGGMFHGIYVAGGTQTSQSIFNNQVYESSDKAIRFASASTTIGMFKNNILIGTTGASVNNPQIPSVASASSIAIPTAHDAVFITGTTNIDTISAEGHSGHIVALIFQGVLTVNDGSNLKLAGNFTTSADDCLTLVCNGTNWYEIARSAN